MRRTLEQKLFYYSQPRLYERALEELQETEEKVIWLLSKYPKLRNSDKLLVFYYWKLVDGYEGDLKDSDILGLTNAETVRRVRAKIQNNYGLWLPTNEDVIKARQIKEAAYEKWSVCEQMILK